MVRFPGPFPFSLQLSAAVPDVGVAVTVEESLATDVVTVLAGARLVGGEMLNALKLVTAVDFAFVMPVDIVVVVVVVVVVVFEDVDLVV